MYTTISQTEHDTPKPGQCLEPTGTRALNTNSLVLTELYLLSYPVGNLQLPSAVLLNVISANFAAVRVCATEFLRASIAWVAKGKYLEVQVQVCCCDVAGLTRDVFSPHVARFVRVRNTKT